MNIDTMNIEEIVKACELDAGQPLPELAQSLQEAKEGNVIRHEPAAILLKNTRAKLTMTQNEFADLIKTPIGTLRDWEQGRIEPSGVAITLAGLLNKHPSLIKDIQQY